jgi:hypothetical protein
MSRLRAKTRGLPLPCSLQKQEIEEQKVEQNKHRDALGFSSKWVQSLLHLCTRLEEERRA